jgi:hypothetical protein
MTDLHIIFRDRSGPARAKRIPPNLAKKLVRKYKWTRVTYNLEGSKGPFALMIAPQKCSVIESREVEEADRDWKQILRLPSVRVIETESHTPEFDLFLHVGAEPFVEPENRGGRRHLLWSMGIAAEELASLLGLGEIRKLRGKIPENAYAELLAARLRET